MKVARIAHAGLVVSSRRALCVMDPVLVQPFDGSTFDPPIQVDTRAVPRSPELLVLSHSHSDHLSLPTLDLFDRATPVVFPAGEPVLEEVLSRMGFEQRKGLRSGVRFTVEDLELFPTASRVPFPEMGILFRSRGRTCWNMVDTAVDEAIVTAVRQLARQPDVLLAPYQPLIERPLWSDALGSGFPHDMYGRLLRTVLDVHPRCVVPASCGFRFDGEDWRNDRMFPLTEEQFLADVGKLEAGITGRTLPPGAELAVERGFPVSEGVLPFIRRRGAARLASHEWRPDRGIPPLEDTNGSGYPLRELRRTVRAYLGRQLLAELKHPRHALWRERMARLEVLWSLEVVYPGGAIERYEVDLARTPLRLETRERKKAGGRRFAKILTAITASSVQDLLEGVLSPYSIGGKSFRTTLRLYEPHREGVRQAGSPDDEPLTRTLLAGADARYIARQLAQLGY